eukprot:7095966-Alexandrium_andersonii.AAC.1
MRPQRKYLPAPPSMSTSVTGSPRTPRCWQREEGQMGKAPTAGVPSEIEGAHVRREVCARGKRPR